MMPGQGVEGLRVVHARSFVSAHINACVLMMMTEKAADLIQAAARAPVAATDRY
jgi:hypothetical protein